MFSLDPNTISALYHEQGYVVLRKVFDAEELSAITKVLDIFHQQWLVKNEEFFKRKAINSAYITDRNLLDTHARTLLFQLIGSERIAKLLRAVFPGAVAFMNTQLFFNPHNPEQKNYWHRDIQYSGMPIAEQIKALAASNVIHVRLPLMPEPGLELIPQSHSRWDTDLEFSVRMAQEGRAVHDALPGAERIALGAGDLLLFSANMLHRGLYGGQRMAFDMLFCDPLPSLVQYVNPDCLPSAEQMQAVRCPGVFEQTQKVLRTL